MLRSLLTFIQIPSTTGKVALVVLNLFLSAQQVNAQSLDPLIAEKVTVAQRQMIQKLTGTTAIRAEVKLASRSTTAERGEVADFLYKSLANDGLHPQKHHYKTSNKLRILDLFFDPYIGTNIYTTIPSTVPSNEYVLLGAHYDSERGSPGANDNATGISLAYQVALHLNQLNHRGRNFIIVFFDQEEDDLVGSRAFAHKMLKDGVIVHSVHTADMLGWDADNDGAIELEYPTAELKSLYQRAALELEIPLYQTEVSASDHEAFRSLGYKAVGITEEYANGDSTPHYHKSTDIEATVDYHFLLNATQLVWSAMKALASNPQIN